MRTVCGPLPTALLGFLGFVSGTAGCSGDGAEAPSNNGMGTAGSSIAAGSSAGGSQSGTHEPSAGSSSVAGAGTGGGSSSGGGGGAATSGNGAGGTSAAGMTGSGGSSAGGANGGTSGSGAGGAAMGGSASGGGGGQGSATCTASKSTGKTVTGTGPHQVVIEANSENGIKCGTIYRPKDMGGAEKYPILVWGEGSCSQNGYDNLAAMGEIASWGYFVVADGTPGGSNACAGGQNGSAFLDYLSWAIAENSKPCSAYYQSLETTKIAADGFSCGGLMAENASGDARFSAIGFTSSGLMSANAALYEKIHTPFKIMSGGSGDIAYQNGLRDYQEISSRGKPIIYFSKSSAGHGGDLANARGDFNSVNLAWLNWQLKGDLGATGKGFLMGATCKFCTDAGWTYKSANIQ